MQTFEEIPCPYCGQMNTLAVDASLPRQEWISDCEVCCRPFQVTVECADGEILSLDARGE